MGDVTTRVEIESTKLTENGQRYRVTFVGEVLVEGRRNPIFDACRALLTRGMTGRLEVWRPGKQSADMQLDIEWGAGLAITETAERSLQVARWHPWWRDQDVASPNAVLYGGGQPLAAICKTPVPEHCTNQNGRSWSYRTVARRV